MTDVIWLGLGLMALAGIVGGNCMLPMKFARRWPWENMWLVFSLVALLVVPGDWPFRRREMSLPFMPR